MQLSFIFEVFGSIDWELLDDDIFDEICLLNAIHMYKLQVTCFSMSLAIKQILQTPHLIPLYKTMYSKKSKNVVNICFLLILDKTMQCDKVYL